MRNVFPISAYAKHTKKESLEEKKGVVGSSFNLLQEGIGETSERATIGTVVSSGEYVFLDPHPGESFWSASSVLQTFGQQETRRAEPISVHEAFINFINPSPAMPQYYYPESRIIPINSLADKDLTLKKPIYVSVMEDDEEFIATFDDLNLYGYGRAEHSALNRLKDEIVYLYKQLASEPKLGRQAKKHKTILQEIVQVK